MVSAEGKSSSKKQRTSAKPKSFPSWLYTREEEESTQIGSTIEEEKRGIELADALGILKTQATKTPIPRAPPTGLLWFIETFLQSYGFGSTSQVFSLERLAREEVDGWSRSSSDHSPSDSSLNLVEIYENWRSKQDGIQSAKRSLTTNSDNNLQADPESFEDDTSSDTSDPDSQDENDSGSSSEVSTSSGSSSESSSKSSLQTPPTSKPKLERKIRPSSVLSSYESSDEKSTLKKPLTQKETPLRKLSSPSTSSSSEDSNEDAIEDSPWSSGSSVASSSPKTRSEAEVESDFDSSHSESDESEEEVSKDEEHLDGLSSTAPNTTPPSAITNQEEKSIGKPLESDSSTTLKAPSPLDKSTAEPASSSSSSESSSSSGDIKSTLRDPSSNVTTLGKRKPALVVDSRSEPSAKKARKATNTPFQRVPESIKTDPRLVSNAYVPYDYADRAYRDLINTKGKGFTKEKNKKKRGS